MRVILRRSRVVFNLCESKGSELASDFFEWAKKAISDYATARWYEKVSLIKAYQSQIMSADTLNSVKSKKAVDEIQYELTKEKKSKLPDWEVIYACVEGLEQALLKLQNNDAAWKNIIKGVPDPEYPKDPEKNLVIGLEQLANYHSPLFTHNAWCIRARIIQMAFTLQKNKQHYHLTAWAIDVLREKGKAVAADPALKESGVYHNPPENWEQYLTTLKTHWPERKTELQSSIEAIGFEIPKIIAKLEKIADQKSEQAKQLYLQLQMAQEQRSEWAQWISMMETMQKTVERIDATVTATHAVVVGAAAAARSSGERVESGVAELQVAVKQLETQVVGLHERLETNIESILNKLRKHYRTSKEISKIELYPGKEHVSISEAFIHLAIIEKEEQDQDESLEDLRKAKPEAKREEIFAAIKNEGEELSSLRLLVLGRPGIGKSTLCRHIAHAWADEKALDHQFWKERYTAVFRISLRTLHGQIYQESGGTSWINLIDLGCFAEDRLSDSERPILQKAIENNPDQFLFLLDGLDELPSVAKESHLGKAVQKLRSMPHCLITSRPTQAAGIEADRRLEVTGFTPKNIEEYIERFFTDRGVINAARASELLGYLKSQTAIRAIAHIPLQLSMICQLKAENKLELDDKKLTLSILYQRLTDGVFERNVVQALTRSGEDIPKAGISSKEYASVKAVLEEFAYDRMFDENIIIFNEAQLGNTIQSVHPNTNKETQAQLLMESKNCSLMSRVYGSNEYEFKHLTYQEYLASGYVANAIQKGGAAFESIQAIILQHRDNPKFQVMWRFVAGRLAHAKNTALLKNFLNLLSSKTFFTKRNFNNYERRLLLACLSECGEYQSLVSREFFLDALLNDLKNKSTSIREVFKKIDYQASMFAVDNTLQAALDHKEADVRCYAIETLEKLAFSEKIPTLCDRFFTLMLQDKDEKVRLAALEAFGKLTSVETKKHFCGKLFKATLENENPAIRLAAALALEKFASTENKKSFREQLLMTALENENGGIALHAAEAFQHFVSAVDVAFFDETLPTIILKAKLCLIESNDSAEQLRAVRIIIRARNFMSELSNRDAVFSFSFRLHVEKRDLEERLERIKSTPATGPFSFLQQDPAKIRLRIRKLELDIEAARPLALFQNLKHGLLNVLNKSIDPAAEKIKLLETISFNLLSDKSFSFYSDKYLTPEIKLVLIRVLVKLAMPKNREKVCMRLQLLTYERVDRNHDVKKAAENALEKLRLSETKVGRPAGVDLFANPIANPPQNVSLINSARAIIAQYEKGTREALIAKHGSALFSAAPAARTGDDVIIDAYKQFTEDRDETKLSCVLSKIEPTGILKTIIENVTLQSAPAAAARAL